jgi:hypothetical protein
MVAEPEEVVEAAVQPTCSRMTRGLLGRISGSEINGHSWEEVHGALTKVQAERMAGRRVGSSSQTVAE